jgi:hypothetical protein
MPRLPVDHNHAGRSRRSNAVAVSAETDEADFASLGRPYLDQRSGVLPMVERQARYQSSGLLLRA